MIHLRRSQQYSFGDGLIAEQTSDLWEPWMRQADRVLEDEQLISAVYHALLKRRPKSGTRGRLGTPAEIVLRLLILKHIRNWSFEVVEREVRGNLVYREFTRVGAAKVPDAKSLGRQALALGVRSNYSCSAGIIPEQASQTLSAFYSITRAAFVTGLGKEQNVAL